MKEYRFKDERELLLELFKLQLRCMELLEKQLLLLDEIKDGLTDEV